MIYFLVASLNPLHFLLPFRDFYRSLSSSNRVITGHIHLRHIGTNVLYLIFGYVVGLICCWGTEIERHIIIFCFRFLVLLTFFFRRYLKILLPNLLFIRELRFSNCCVFEKIIFSMIFQSILYFDDLEAVSISAMIVSSKNLHTRVFIVSDFFGR